MTLKEAIVNRRSYYGISKESPLTDEQIIDLTETALKHTPSAFNMQSARIVLLLGNAHDTLWDMTLEILRPLVPTDKFAATKGKIASFKAGYGTILFLEDMKTVNQLAAQFPTYKDNFPIWAEQANGMLQSNIWMLLEEAGLGASLQHYNPLIDDKVHQIWNIPNEWRLVAQMPFGKPTKQPDSKEFIPIENRIKIFKK